MKSNAYAMQWNAVDSTVLCYGNRTEWSPFRSVITQVITKSDDRAAGIRFVYYEVLLPINHKNYNFREKMNSQVMKEREN